MESKAVARHLFQKGLSAIDETHLKLPLEDLPGAGITLLGSGKAAPTMVRAVMRRLGKDIKSALIVTDQQAEIPGVEVLRSTHPIPSQKSVIAAERMLEIIGGLDKHDFLLYLLSGGTSAMVEKPIPPVSPDDLQRLNTLLLKSGAPIGDINTVRKALSLVKGGGLAQVSKAPGRVLVMSDVIGDDLSVIGSAPFYGKGNGTKSAKKVLKRHALWESVPQTVRMVLDRRQTHTGEGEKVFEHTIVASNRMVLGAIAAEAKSVGYTPHIVTDRLGGDVKEAAGVILQHARKYENDEKVCLIFGGETTVEVRGKGRGGRNQELALWVLKGMEPEKGFTFLSAGTDGIDGVTDAAGAIVCQGDLHADIDDYLKDNDSYRYHDRYGTLLRTGRTGLNVMDIQIVVKG